MTPGWLAAAADEFWGLAGAPPPYPRELGSVLSMALPIYRVVVPRLTPARVEAWLARRHRQIDFDTAPRSLRGCLVAFRGTGFIFVDGADDPAEQRFTLAHEIAHYLLDYRAPRQSTLRRLGPSILPVLDGERPAARHERIDAVLTSSRLGYYIHLFDRGRADVMVDISERRADDLAFELLAPSSDLVSRVHPDASAEQVAALLVAEFGFPQAAAETYARSWMSFNLPAPSTLRWLRR